MTEPIKQVGLRAFLLPSAAGRAEFFFGLDGLNPYHSLDNSESLKN